jgi:hypothetical protein
MPSIIKVDQIQSDTGTVNQTSNLSFTGTGRRITGDMSNASYANRFGFQNSITDGSSSFVVIPNGTATSTGMQLFNSSDPDNSTRVGIQLVGSQFQLRGSRTGTGSHVDLAFYTSDTQRLNITTAGVVELNSGQLKFPASQAASSDPNTLDDYEEGTYTPVFRQNGGGTILTYGTQYALLSAVGTTEASTLAYVKIGRVVYIAGAIRFKQAGITGRFNLSLPFTITGSDYGLSGSTGLYNFDQTLNQGTFLGLAGAGVDFFDLGSGNGAHVNLTTKNGSEIYFNFF